MVDGLAVKPSYVYSGTEHLQKEREREKKNQHAEIQKGLVSYLEPVTRSALSFVNASKLGVWVVNLALYVGSIVISTS